MPDSRPTSHPLSAAFVLGVLASLSSSLGCRASGGGAPTSLLLSPAELASPPSLGVGDSAPALVAAEWPVGPPLTALLEGKVVVLDSGRTGAARAPRTCRGSRRCRSASPRTASSWSR